MSAARTIPPAVTLRQIEASDPRESAWVAANAGSGKTHVLAQRVIRLLLAGVDPARILCVTFTKAAAANMANRVFDELRRWATYGDAQLDDAIGTISNVTPDDSVRALARRLFAQALETPGGLKVQTIHAFCTRLLQQFPFEADVAARFEVLDEASEAKLLEQMSLSVLLDAAAAPDSALGRALATAIAAAADQTFKDVVGEAIRKRDIVRGWVAHGGSVDAAIAGLCGALKVGAADTIETVERQMTEGPLFPAKHWGALAKALAAGSKADQGAADKLLSALAGAGVERTKNYLSVFLTGEGEPRKRLVTKAIETGDPALVDRLNQERDRLVALAERRRGVECRDRTAALLTIADTVIARYQNEKARRGLLDYDDLIDKTLDLLGEDRAAWVHYKLDRGIDHVLIDEAQDTSPKQWQIVRALTAEFFAGKGAREVRRTIFAVGDEKQSIFSFQGAAPREFDEMYRAFAKLSEGIERTLPLVRLRHSFRSGPNVLSAVDVVFEQPHAFAGLSADNVPPVHEALPSAAPGVVEIWETIKPAERPESEAWSAPFDATNETSPQAQLADRIARTVAHWRRQGTRPGDVLVLVRQRGALFEAIIRALKDHDVPVAGADRLVLTEHIAVMDLMVLVDALLLPDDDLALATVLKSPLFGLDEDDLFALAWNRQGALRAALAMNPSYANAAAQLRRYAAWAGRETPFDFFSRLLGPERGRKRILARLGPEADDALNEFLNLALDYESRETPSLQGFVAWLRGAKTDVKRDMEISRDEVRVMTVHGAKGLEAPVVFLADTTTPPAGHYPPRLLALAGGGAPGTPAPFVWALAKATDVTQVSEAREAARREAENEYRRLLYVAMTRAADRLIVCGVDGARKRPEGCWYDLVVNALKERCTTEPADHGDGTVLRYRKCPAKHETATRESAAPSAEIAEDLPAWLTRDVDPEPPPAAPLSPSQAYDETAPLPRADAAGRKLALARGIAMHRLLQSLPEIPPERRAAAAQRHLARNNDVFTQKECGDLVASVIRLLEDPRFFKLFAPGSRAEVPVVGRIQIGSRIVPVAGVLDRLAVTGDAVLIADYKTNRPPPAMPPEAYVAQLALYRAVLGQIYPGKPIRAALIWTETPDLVELSAAAMDTALASLTS